MSGAASSSDPGGPAEVVRLDGPVHGPVRLAAGEVTFEAGTTIRLPAGAPVPTVVGVDASEGPEWAAPSSGAGGRDHPLYRTYSLLLALLFGTMGLPHVLVRFYTNPDGRAARRTTLVVIGLLGAFYLFPPVYGALGRVYAPELLLTGRTDAVVLLLPRLMLPEPWGDLVAALLVAGAFAAFLSTASGLTVSVAGVLSQDLLRGRARASVPGFRVGAALAVLVPALLSLPAIGIGLADTVGLAFALAASTFCPLLALGIWWRGLTVPGATAGLLTGGAIAGTAVIVTMAGGSSRGLFGALMAQPALWSVPVAFSVMVAVSLATARRAGPSTRRVMVRLHTPEAVELDRG
jgi:Na+(H+)/acetate symporter ActP